MRGPNDVLSACDVEDYVLSKILLLKLSCVPPVETVTKLRDSIGSAFLIFAISDGVHSVLFLKRRLGQRLARVAPRPSDGSSSLGFAGFRASSLRLLAAGRFHPSWILNSLDF
jgi:hypothetical protein